MTTPASLFFEQPILNSPYEEPARHHPLDAEGQPLNEPPRDGRRKSELITPVPKPRKKKRKSASKDQGNLNLQNDDGLSTEEQEYNPTPIINEIRIHVGEWRRSNPGAWGRYSRHGPAPYLLAQSSVSGGATVLLSGGGR